MCSDTFVICLYNNVWYNNIVFFKDSSVLYNDVQRSGVLYNDWVFFNDSFSMSYIFTLNADLRLVE